MATDTLPAETTCCIAGGGPAGMMLGLLLARAGIDVVVLEKHADFLRDFRGDTVHPSTLEVMHELGLLEAFLARPHQELQSLGVAIGGDQIQLADFSHVPTRCKFIALMPQWHFLDFLAGEAKRYPGFHLAMSAEAVGLVEREGRVAGVRVRTATGEAEIASALTIGADGRHSTLRDAAGFKVDDLGAPMDVLWFRLSRRPDDAAETLGHVEAGGLFITINRGDYWQCAYIIAKGSLDALKAEGIARFRADVARFAPGLADRTGEIAGFDDVKLLTVAVDRLERWHRPGLLCIGDAAHAMSPIGGVGINLAIQDAVAAANILAGPLGKGLADEAVLARVQRRRSWPTRVTQRAQLIVQRRVIDPILHAEARIKAPWLLKLFSRFPLLRRLPARMIGIGVRPEHVRTPDTGTARQDQGVDPGIDEA